MVNSKNKTETFHKDDFFLLLRKYEDLQIYVADLEEKYKQLKAEIITAKIEQEVFEEMKKKFVSELCDKEKEIYLLQKDKENLIRRLL